MRDAAPLFSALGDETRLELVARLARLGPASISRLSEKADVTRQAITKHLEVLSEAGLVRSRRVGRERVYELEPKRLTDVHRHLEAIARHWELALARCTRADDGALSSRR